MAISLGWHSRASMVWLAPDYSLPSGPPISFTRTDLSSFPPITEHRVGHLSVDSSIWEFVSWAAVINKASPPLSSCCFPQLEKPTTPPLMTCSLPASSTRSSFQVHQVHKHISSFPEFLEHSLFIAHLWHIHHKLLCIVQLPAPPLQGHGSCNPHNVEPSQS